jgi:hypothetical protein
MRSIIALSALMFSTLVSAEHPPQEQPNAPSTSSAVAGAAAGAVAGVNAPIDIDIAVTPAPISASQSLDVSADGGESNSSASASNEGVTQVTAINHRRNAPSLAQGGLAVAGCGAGANGGGSREGGAGFLGLVWTTDQCYALLAAASFAAIGMPDTSCDLLVSMKSVRKAFKRAGKPLPDCASAENRDLPSAAQALTGGLIALERMRPDPPKCKDCASREELDRAFRASQKK